MTETTDITSEIQSAGDDSRHPHPQSKHTLHRCRTAPAITFLQLPPGVGDPEAPSDSPCSDMRTIGLLLLLYLSAGVLAYYLNPDGYSGADTHPFVDGLYFCIVTVCTIGYGDIVPVTPLSKAVSCAFVLVSFGFLDLLLSGVISYLLDAQENLIVAASQKGSSGAISYIFDVQKGRTRIRLKVGMAVGVVILCIAFGAMFLYFIEEMDWLDSFYLSVMSVTTVGYGDRAFKTLTGRLFASCWLAVSTFAVARAFLFLMEARINRRQRRYALKALQKDLTVEDLFAADINHNGYISKSEFVIYKLKEMKKIAHRDVWQICNQFNKLDRNNTGKITLPDLLNHDS